MIGNIIKIYKEHPFKTFYDKNKAEVERIIEIKLIKIISEIDLPIKTDVIKFKTDFLDAHLISLTYDHYSIKLINDMIIEKLIAEGFRDVNIQNGLFGLFKVTFNYYL